MRFSIVLNRLAIKNDLAFRECNEFHLQIKGLYTVNIYESKSSYYINGTNKKGSFNINEPEFLINLAKGEGDLSIDKDKANRKKFKRTKKLILWQKNPTCFYCQELIENWEYATIEHKIPLCKGGSNRNDNLALSHLKCNQERGSGIGIIKK